MTQSAPLCLFVSFFVFVFVVVSVVVVVVVLSVDVDVAIGGVIRGDIVGLGNSSSNYCYLATTVT